MTVKREDLYKIINEISDENLPKVKEILNTLRKYEKEIEEVEPTVDEIKSIDEGINGSFYSFEEVFEDDL
jgi:predicted transcriptional regulator